MRMRFLKFRTAKKIALAVTCCLIAACVSLPQSEPETARAATREEAEKDKEEAEEEEKNAKDVLEAIEEEQNKIVQEVAELDSEATQIQTQITENEEKAETLQSQIEDTRDRLKEAQKAEDEQYAAMKSRIQYIYEEGETDYIDMLLSSETFAVALNNSEYIGQILKYDQNQLSELAATRQSVADYKESLENDLLEVESVNAELEEYQVQLQDKIEEKEAQISKYDDDKEAQSALMAKFTAKRESLEKQIEEMTKQEAAKKGSTYTSDGKVYDTSAYAGRFMWPVSTGGVITDYFGYRDAPTAGASTYHQGLDIGCDYGTDIVAADDGTVIMSCYNGGAGNMVMISHDDGICTVYMHNSQLCVNVGERVVKGQVVAKAGSTGVSTGTHCHFGVQINGTYVDPQDFL